MENYHHQNHHSRSYPVDFKFYKNMDERKPSQNLFSFFKLPKLSLNPIKKFLKTKKRSK